MGLIICITACCCGYCAYKKHRNRKRRRNEEENELEPNGDIPGRETGNGQQEGGEAGTIVSGDAGHHDGTQQTADGDRPPPYPHPGESAVDVIIDENEQRERTSSSSKQMRYSHLTDESNKEVRSTAADKDQHLQEPVSVQKSRDVKDKSQHQTITEDPKETKQTMGKGEEEVEEEDNGVNVGARKHSSKKYKYSVLKAGGGTKEKKRTKSETDSHHQECDEIRIPLSPDIDGDHVIVTSPSYV